MRTISTNDLIALISLCIAIVTSLIGLVFWYVNTEKRKYGLERDFAHIKRNYDQISQNLKVIISEIDHRFDAIDKTLIEIKSKIYNK